ncbi:hypothetical protein CFC21_039153 [Triticum aestivum]|uniref:F-box protein AT5G49610-like beta-propeller domain-containing protein n=3 Tax=Triticum TaxID=4564 RepID=A0A9R1FDX4_WHEAT|nr:hypothetical protein CFC21_039153 [Triticum aestivum]CDM80548.1 unnamed protein product [Triticum aestivum]VAH71246.1 unnamed protein product [Triticum turgidum subsp. durum]
MYREYRSIYGSSIARVYSSETNTWSSLISIEASHNKCVYFGPSTLVRNVLYWPSHNWGDNILEFDLDTQNLTVIKGPPGVNYSDNFQIIQAEGGAVGIAVLSYNTLQLWQRTVNHRGDAIWLSCKIVLLRNLINIPPRTGRKRECLRLVGYDEATDVIFLGIRDSVYMVQPKSMQTRQLNVTHSPNYCYPFTSFFPPGYLQK